MTKQPQDGFDLDRLIAARLDDGPTTDAELQALAVLIDADLTDDQRVRAFGALLSAMLNDLNPQQRERFQQIADEQGPSEAIAYLSTVTSTS